MIPGRPNLEFVVDKFRQLFPRFSCLFCAAATTAARLVSRRSAQYFLRLVNNIFPCVQQVYLGLDLFCNEIEGGD